jgi:hypothetical protein
MAVKQKSTAAGAVKAIQRRAEEIAGRIRRDAEIFVRRSRVELTKDIRTIRNQVEQTAERAIRNVERKVAHQLHAASTEQLARLTRRLAKLEQSVAELHRKLATASEKRAA